MSAGPLMVDTVTLAVPTGVDAAAEETYGSQTTISARVEYGTKLIVAPDGRERQSTAWFVTETSVDARSKVWLPDDNAADDTAGRQILATKKAATPGGYTLHEVYV